MRRHNDAGHSESKERQGIFEVPAGELSEGSLVHVGKGVLQKVEGTGKSYQRSGQLVQRAYLAPYWGRWTDAVVDLAERAQRAERITRQARATPRPPREFKGELIAGPCRDCGDASVGVDARSGRCPECIEDRYGY